MDKYRLNELRKMRVEDRVMLAAVEWWESKRPITYTEAEHFSNPAVNTASSWENELAHAVADMLSIR